MVEYFEQALSLLHFPQTAGRMESTDEVGGRSVPPSVPNAQDIRVSHASQRGSFIKLLGCPTMTCHLDCRGTTQVRVRITIDVRIGTSVQEVIAR